MMPAKTALIETAGEGGGTPFLNENAAVGASRHKSPVASFVPLPFRTPSRDLPEKLETFEQVVFVLLCLSVSSLFI